MCTTYASDWRVWKALSSPSASLGPKGNASSLIAVSKASPERIAIVAVGATLLIAITSVGIGLGMLLSDGQARTDAVIAELRRDVHDVRERLARLEGAILAQREPGMGAADG